mmetsp:Transcript_4231/g.8766  ORF Transcript_4231/g.8766 Transcript_4231/m.8766 type:complete len:226 (+) Transcript_4231:1741-2418(+)
MREGLGNELLPGDAKTLVVILAYVQEIEAALGTFGILEGDFKCFLDTLSETDSGTRVCCHIEPRDPLLTSVLGRHLEHYVFPRAKATSLVGDIVGNQDYLPSCWAFDRLYRHQPSNHSHVILPSLALRFSKLKLTIGVISHRPGPTVFFFHDELGGVHDHVRLCSSTCRRCPLTLDGSFEESWQIIAVERIRRTHSRLALRIKMSCEGIRRRDVQICPRAVAAAC